MTPNRLRFYARRALHLGDVFELQVLALSEAGTKGLARPAVFEAITPGATFAQPLLTLEHEDAQALMDELWHAGVRPSDGTGSTGQLAATESHLADMRAIAFHKLGVPK